MGEKTLEITHSNHVDFAPSLTAIPLKRESHNERPRQSNILKLPVEVIRLINEV